MPRRDPERARRAVEELSGSAAESYKSAVERAFSVRESGARVTRHFFEEGMGLMQDNVEGNVRATHRLAEVARVQSETLHRLSEGSSDAYAGFLDSLYDWSAEETGARTREEKARGDGAPGGEPADR